MLDYQSVRALRQLQNVPPTIQMERIALYDAARELMLSLEDPINTVHRVVYSIAISLGIFKVLSATEEAVNISKIAATTGADPVLLGRLLRFLASQGSVEQVSVDTFRQNHTTKTFSQDGYVAGLGHGIEVGTPCLMATPKFLADTKYRNPDDNLNSPFQAAMNTKQPAWEWSMGRPELVKEFVKWISVQHRPDETWMNVTNVEKFCAGASADTPIFVDVGGSIGHQCVALKQRYPHLPGRVILQDTPGPIQGAIPCEGVEPTVFDFWNEQTVKGARIYYLRMVLHDFADEKCVKILKNTRAAMTDESVIVIDEIVIPDTGAHWRATAIDMHMLSSLAATERTESQWHTLLDAAGLKIQSIATYVPESSESAIVAVPR